MMVNGGITKDGLSKCKVDPCGICSLRVKADSVLCVQCGEWIHGGCAGLKRVTASKFSRNVTLIFIGEAVEQEEKLCNKEENSKRAYISW